MDHKNVELVESLRRLVLESVNEARETDRAAADLLAVSFQSEKFPERHVWAYSYEEGVIEIDLEDWNTDETWDNAVARSTVTSMSEAVKIIRDWISGTAKEL